MKLLTATFCLSLCVAGLAHGTPRKEQIKDAEKFNQEVLADAQNASARARLLELVQEQVRAGKLLEFTRNDFTIVLNMGLGWNSKLGKDTQPYVHMFVHDMQSFEVPVVFLEKDPYGTIPANAKTIEPKFKSEFEKDRPLIILTLCKGAPEMVTVFKDVVGPTLDSERRQTRSTRIVSYINMSGMLTGTFYSDDFSQIPAVSVIGWLMEKSPNLDVELNGKGFLASPNMRTPVVEKIVNAGLPSMPSDMFYLNIVGAPTDRNFQANNSALGPFFKLNDRLGLFTQVNDGFLDDRKVEFPAWVSNNRATVTMDATHVLSDGSFGPYQMKNDFERRAIYRAFVQLAIERGEWR